MIPVAAYCRVSTDTDDQANSFSSQQAYFREYIRQHPQWELYRIYADEGITGTSTQKRAQFNRMILDAQAGCFQWILTKEVSRFSRNILDTISYTRQLRSLGIGVIFVTDRINTLEPEAEMLLSFLASLAQEESRRTSARVVWGQTRQMEKGVVFGRSLLGYDVKDGKITVNPEGAETVRLIFHKYAREQMGTAELARFLTREGYQTFRGNSVWKPGSVIKILKNEKYTGDLIQKKTYTPDFLTHAKKANTGQVPFVALENHHEAIISRELWNLAQDRLRRNHKHAKTSSGQSGCHPFSGKIRCGQCGSCFTARYRYRKDGTKYLRWSCATAAGVGTQGCDVGKLLRNDDAARMLKTALGSLPVDVEAMIANVTALAVDAIREDTGQEEVQRLQQELSSLQKKKEAVMDSYFSGEISGEDMQAMKKKYDQRMEKLRQRLEDVSLSFQESSNPETLCAAIATEIAGILTGKADSNVFCKTVLESITIFKDRHMELRLKGLPQIFRFVG